MLTHARRAAPHETGGLLVGYWSESGSEVVVVDATAPGPAAREESNSFTPDYDHDLQVIARRYADSNRRHTYLGDWHSHPTSTAYLSPDDLDALRRIGRDERARAAQPLMIVLGGEDRWTLTVYVWLGESGYFLWRTDHVETVPVKFWG